MEGYFLAVNPFCWEAFVPYLHGSSCSWWRMKTSSACPSTQQHSWTFTQLDSLLSDSCEVLSRAYSNLSKFVGTVMNLLAWTFPGIPIFLKPLTVRNIACIIYIYTIQKRPHAPYFWAWPLVQCISTEMLALKKQTRSAHTTLFDFLLCSSLFQMVFAERKMGRNGLFVSMRY